MNHFYVLRNNREAGPFTLAELKTYGLLSTDLIWADGESNGWKHPSEIEGLDGITINETKQGVKPANKPLPPQPAQPRQFIAGKEFYTAAQNDALHAGGSKPIFRRPEKRATVPSYAVGARLFGTVVLLIGGLLCGFVVVNMLKQFGEKPAAVSQAVELSSKDLPASHTAHTAEAPPSSPLPHPPPLPAPVTETKNTVTSNATAVNAPLKTTEAATAKIKPKPAKKTADKTQTPQPSVAPPPALPQPVEEKPEPVKAPKEKPSLQLSANDYKVGLFGGVSNLEITVSNPSGQSVAKAVVEVEFLKPNGNVVRTQTVSAENIAAGGSKIIPVPSNGRGVKVRYRVVSVE